MAIFFACNDRCENVKAILDRMKHFLKNSTGRVYTKWRGRNIVVNKSTDTESLAQQVKLSPASEFLVIGPLLLIEHKKH